MAGLALLTDHRPRPRVKTQTCALRSLTAKGVSDMFIHFSGQNHHKGGTPKDPFFTFSARLAQPRGQHPPHHQHHLHQCPPWMRMMHALPGMLSTMGTPQKTLVFDSAGSRSKNDPFSPKTHPNILSPLAARSQRKSIAHGRRMVGGGRRHRAAGPVPEGRPSEPRPSAVSRTTGSEAPRWPDRSRFGLAAGLAALSLETKKQSKATRVHAIKCLRIGPCARCLGTYRFEQCETLGQ